jgi:hypothetical protein
VQDSPIPLKQADVRKPPKLDFAVFDDAQGDGADTTSLLTLPVLQKPQAASFAIFSDFDDDASTTGKKPSGACISRRVSCVCLTI